MSSSHSISRRSHHGVGAGVSSEFDPSVQVASGVFAYIERSTTIGAGNAPGLSTTATGSHPDALTNAWTTNITWIQTRQGWLYLAVAIAHFAKEGTRYGFDDGGGSVAPTAVSRA